MNSPKMDSISSKMEQVLDLSTGSIRQSKGEEHLLREERALVQYSSGRWTNGTIPFTFDTDTLSEF